MQIIDDGVELTLPTWPKRTHAGLAGLQCLLEQEPSMPPIMIRIDYQDLQFVGLSDPRYQLTVRTEMLTLPSESAESTSL